MKVKIVLSFAIFCAIIAVGVSGRNCASCGYAVEENRPCSCSSRSRVSTTYESDVLEPEPRRSDNSYSASLYAGVPVKVSSNKQHISRSRYAEQFKPVGDVCACSHRKVQPAQLPSQKYCLDSKVKSPSCDKRPLVPAPSYMHDFSQDEEYVDTAFPEEMECGIKKPLYPVDAVSIDLVNRMQQNAAISIPEEKLQYGFWNLPREIPSSRASSNIPEERLFTVDRQIVELKNPRRVIKCGTDDDEEIILEDKEPAAISYLSYRDLGFVPESEDAERKFIPACQEKRRTCSRDSEDRDYVSKVRRGDSVFMKKLSGSCGCN